MDVSGKRHKGVLSADDMAKWRAPVEAPATYDYRGVTVCKAGPWSQGPVLLQLLALLYAEHCAIAFLNAFVRRLIISMKDMSLSQKKALPSRAFRNM